MPFSFSARTRLLLVALVLSTIVGLAAAMLNARGHIELGVATTHVMVDFPGPSITERHALVQDRATLHKRAELYGRAMTSQPVLDAIARRVGVPAGSVSGVARLKGVPIPLMQPDSEPRASQIVDSWAPYRLELQSDSWQPILNVYAAAPSPAEAEKLANASVTGLHDFLADLARQQGFPESGLPELRQLGAVRGKPINGKARPVILGLTFVVGFSLTFILLATLIWLHTRGPRSLEPHPRPADDDWPHTTRLLPWAVAAFLTMLWLTPFDRIELSFNTPIDMKLDRIVLPIVVALWVIALAIGGRVAPRIRLTPIHVALGAFVAVAFLSVTLDARYLNQTMELMLSLKKLPLLLAYVSLFLIVSTAIRPSEVGAFMTLTLALAVIVGLGIIVEFRFVTNIFSLIPDKLLPPPFVLTGDATAGGGLDSLGRRGIVGPTAVGVEAVAVLALALPIAVVRLLSTKVTKQRVIYAIATCILVAGMFATGRKSGLLAPLAVLLALGYFRRRELLSMAPYGLVMALAITVMSPGAVHGVLSQFLRDDSSSVATTSDRVADYDAVRPDVWTHLLFGRGFGAYEHDTYRILDSEILSRTVETGVIGLLAFLAIGTTVVIASRKTINRRREPYASIALMGAASAVAFITASTLFDITGFPHATYIFLYIAGLVAVVIGRGEDAMRAQPRRRRPLRVRRREPHASPSPTHTLV